jgi:hypothetical protein
MKPRKDRKYNTYLRNLESQQEIRINEAGANAYQDYTLPKEQGTMFTDRFKIKGEQRI